MPSRFTGKLCQFLFQHLERGTFGERLRWLDRPSGVFQLVWKHGNGSSTVPHRDCAVFLAWDRYKARGHRCKPFDAKQRFRAAMSKMKLQLLEAWGLHEPKQGYQIRKFPRADLDHLLKKAHKKRATRRSRRASVSYDSVSGADTDSTATEGSSSELPKEKSLLNNANVTSPGPEEYQRSRREVDVSVVAIVRTLLVLLGDQEASAGNFACLGCPGDCVKCILGGLCCSG
ncbi:interferon regulatory factor 1-like [Dermacentor silvarum]|uniref:interferon regulatory factor 1-like n=1 Tax=Dermacentor silvarum TaxID=543639 RepID=UPI002100A1ED|nr:interferon regulatory factor 1-like [Dermacentor silvarum]